MNSFFKLFVALIIILGPVFHSTAQQVYPSDPDEVYYRAIKLMDAKNLASARKEFEAYLENVGEGNFSAEASYYRAYCALVLYHKDGEKLIEDFVENYPEHPKTSTAFFELGRVFYKSRNYPKTIEYLKRANLGKLSSSDRDEALFMLGYGHFSLKKLKEAHPYFNQLKSSSKKYGTASCYYAGIIEYESGQYREAVNDFSKAERDESYSREVPYMKAAALFKLESHDELLSYTLPLLESGNRFSNEEQLYLLTAEAYFMMEKFAKAEEYYSEYARRIRGKIESDVQYRVAFCQYKQNKYEEASENFKDVAGRNDDASVYASYYLGVLYVKEGNQRYALTAFDKVRRNKTDKELGIQGEYQYAKLSYDVGNTSQAISSMTFFIENYPESDHLEELSELLSEAYLSTNDYQKAIKHIESQRVKTKRLKEAYQKANYLLGTEFFNKGDYRRAVDLFDASLTNPLNQDLVINALYWSAEAYSVGKRYEEAQTRYLRILNSFSGSSNQYIDKSHYGLGYTYYNSEKYSSAEDQFYKFVSSKPEVSSRILSDAYVRLADCRYVRKEYNQAVANYQTALKTNSSGADYIYLQLGMVNALQENNPEAEGFFNRVIAQGVSSPYYEDALYQSAQLSFNKTEYKQAIQSYSKLIASRPSSRYVPFALMKRASAFYNMGQKKEAIADYERIFNDHIRHETAREALIPMQELLSEAGRGDEYDKYLASYKKANPDQKGLETVEFETARNQYFSQNYQKAIDGLSYFVENYPADARVEEATYYVGDSYYRLNRLNMAKTWLRKLENNTSFWHYSKVVDRLASIAMKERDFQAAARYFKKVEQLSSNSRQQNEARVGLMEAFYMTGKYDSAVFYARTILNSGPTNVNTENKASLFLGKSYLEMGNYEMAQDEFLNTTNNAKDVFGAEAQFLLGKIFYLNKQYKHSIEVLIDLNERYGTFQEWVGKGFLLIADNYVGLEDYFQAKGTLNSLIEYFPGEGVKEEARLKLKEIEKSENSPLPTDSLKNQQPIKDASNNDK